MNKDDVVIIIPAYNPGEELLKLLNRLEDNKYTNIIVVDDGSDNKNIFNQISQKIIVRSHCKNLGKGNALKTAMKYALLEMKIKLGIITVDADGQHLIQDINNMYFSMKREPGLVVLGCRDFKNGHVPLKSLIGNRFMSLIVLIKFKKYITDTQTGLRGIPIKEIYRIIDLAGEKYEYEMNELKYFIKNKVIIKEIKIRCVYIDKNKKSNFRPIRDSIRCLMQI